MGDLVDRGMGLSIGEMNQIALQSLLVVTDNTDLAALWLALAEQSSCAASRCADMRSARVSLQYRLPDTVVVDLDMADQQGWKLVQSLRGEQGDLEFPWIIGLLSIMSEEAVDAAMGAGVNDAVSKEADIDVFKQKLVAADCVCHERKLYGTA